MQARPNRSAAAMAASTPFRSHSASPATMRPHTRCSPPTHTRTRTMKARRPAVRRKSKSRGVGPQWAPPCAWPITVRPDSTRRTQPIIPSGVMSRRNAAPTCGGIRHTRPAPWRTRITSALPPSTSVRGNVIIQGGTVAYAVGGLRWQRVAPATRPHAHSVPRDTHGTGVEHATQLRRGPRVEQRACTTMPTTSRASRGEMMRHE